MEPDFVAGHSYGEYVALYAAGALNVEDFIRLSEARGRFILEGVDNDPGAMAAVECSAAAVEELIDDIAGVGIANLNSPSQTIISGGRAAVEAAMAKLSAEGKRARRNPRRLRLPLATDGAGTAATGAVPFVSEAEPA